ncbi:Ig-like domain-containing protein [Actinorhabdospora filicis]|nr:Ig-like domain-containing protein [Actinorhabdospora filicis]
MKTLSRATAVGGTAFALLLAAPALAHAEDAKTGLTCEVDANLTGTIAYHETSKLAEFCHGAPGAEIKAVALAHADDGVKARIAEDGLSIAIDVDFMDLGVEYTAEITVTDGTNRATFTWAAVEDMRGTPPIAYKADKDGKATGDLSRNDYREDFEYTVHTGPKHGDLKLNADGTFAYTGDKNFAGDRFYYKVAWKTKHHGTVYEVREATVTASPAPTPSPSKSTAKPSPSKSSAKPAAKKDKLPETGSPAPMLAGTGLGALALGGGAIWLARRRRNS